MESSEIPSCNGAKIFKDIYPLIEWNNLNMPERFESLAVKEALRVQNLIYATDKRSPSDNQDVKEATIRTSKSIPQCTGQFYFEIQILDRPDKNRTVSVGLVNSKSSRYKHPGAESSSIGLHLFGDNKITLLYNNSRQDVSFDVSSDIVNIGCVVDFIDHLFCFTINGVRVQWDRKLPSIDKFPMNHLFPCFGSQSPQVRVKLILDPNQFTFDFKQTIQDSFSKRRREYIQKTLTPDLSYIKMKELVSSYLIHHGHVGAYTALNRHADHGKDMTETLDSVRKRRQIREEILRGAYLSAVHWIEDSFPDFFVKYPCHKFTLKCRHFVDMVCGQIHHQSRTDLEENGVGQMDISPTAVTAPKSAKLDPGLIKSSEGINTLKDHSGSSPLYHHYANSPASINSNNTNGTDCSNGDLMETDPTDQYHPATSNIIQSSSQQSLVSASPQINGSAEKKLGNKRDGSRGLARKCVSLDASCARLKDSSGAKKNYACDDVLRIIEYGRQLRKLAEQLCTDKSLIYDHSCGRAFQLLKDAFSLIAYHDPYSSPFKEMLSSKHREELAQSINGAIMATLNQPSETPIDTSLSTFDRLTTPKNTCCHPLSACIHPRLLLLSSLQQSSKTCDM